MKDSFYSFCDVEPEEWKINIRGRLKHKASDFLKSELKDNVDIFFLNSSHGWFYDSQSYMNDIQSDYIFVWIEDHICQVNPKLLRDVIAEMSILSADQLLYSWFHKSTLRTFSFCRFRIVFKILLLLKSTITLLVLPANVLVKIFMLFHYLVFFRKDIFTKALNSQKPYLKRWPKYLPFDFEKQSKDCFLPTMLTALPTKELFAAIDDNHGNPGYSLISRCKYPNRVSKGGNSIT